MTRWLLAFAWTLALELPVYTWLLSSRARSWQQLCGLVLLVNAITHPLLWFGFPRLTPYWLYLVTGEGCVLMVEAAILAIAFRDVRRAAIASLAANLTSTVIGLVVMRIAG